MKQVFQTGDVHIDQGDMASNLKVLTWMVDEAISRGVDVFIHAGDGFATGSPSQEAFRVVYEQFSRLVKARIPLVLLEGNHERIGVLGQARTATATLGITLSGLTGAEVFFAEKQPKLFATSTGIQVAALPWTTGTSEAYLGKDPDQADKEVAKMLGGMISDLGERIDPHTPSVFTSHLAVWGAVHGSEDDLNVSRFHEPVVMAETIDECGFGFVGLSHIHARQHIGCKVWLAGSPNRLTFTDADKPKSVNLAVFDGPRLVNVERLATPARAMTSIDLAAGGVDPQTIQPGALVRLVLPPGVVEVPAAAIKLVEKAGGKIDKVKKTPALTPTGVRDSLPENTTPLQALNAWMAKEGIPQTDRGRLSELASQLFAPK